MVGQTKPVLERWEQTHIRVELMVDIAEVVPAGLAGFEDFEIEGKKETVGGHLIEVAVGIDHLSALD